MPNSDDPTELEPRKQSPSVPESHSTAAQLRRDVEIGATSDKVPALDPAASPLGTDDEAAGAPLAPEAINAVRRAERAMRLANTSPGRPEPREVGRSKRRVAGPIAFAVALTFGALWISFG